MGIGVLIFSRAAVIEIQTRTCRMRNYLQAITFRHAQNKMRLLIESDWLFPWYNLSAFLPIQVFPDKETSHDGHHAGMTEEGASWHV